MIVFFTATFKVLWVLCAMAWPMRWTCDSDAAKRHPWSTVRKIDGRKFLLLQIVLFWGKRGSDMNDFASMYLYVYIYIHCVICICIYTLYIHIYIYIQSNP